MRKRIYIFVCFAVCLVLLAGCKSDNNSTPSVSAGKNTKEAVSSHYIDTSDWTLSTLLNVNNLDGVTMLVKKETVSSDGLTLKFKNDTNKQCIYGDNFSLEKR